MRTRSRFLWAVAVLAASSAYAPPLHCEKPQAKAEGTRAVEKGSEGIALYEQGKWSEALALFREAEGLYHSPVFVLYEARALRNAGRLLEAREAFRRVASETLDRSAPELWKQAQADGRQELAALEALVPSAVISVKGGSPRASVTVDNRPVVLAVPIELDPGTHRVGVVDGTRQRHQTFTLAAGARDERVVVDLTPPKPQGPVSQGAAQPAAERGVYVPGVVVVAIGGAAILTGGIFGVLALNKKANTENNLPKSCDGTTCPASKESAIQADIDAGKSLGTAADVLLIGGTAVTLAGVGLLILHPGDGPSVTAGVYRRGAFVRADF